MGADKFRLPLQSDNEARIAPTAQKSVAIDGSGNVWVANPNASSTVFTAIVGAAAPTVTPLALGLKNNTLATRP